MSQVRHARVCRSAGERCNGMTLLETLIASAILSASVAGTMSAFVTAIRIQQVQNGPAGAEGAAYGELWLEQNRNHVAFDDAWFSNNIGAPFGVPAWPSFNQAKDNDPATPGNIKRRYKIQQVDCDGDGAPDPRCYSMAVRVCWNDATCP